MEIVKFQKNQTIAKQKDKIRVWYIVLEGTVIQKNGYARVTLEKDAIIGISVGERYLCDYIAGCDCTLAAYPFETPDDLSSIIKGQESMRQRLIRSALNQRQMLLKTYASYHTLVYQFHFYAENLYNEYTNFCIKYNRQDLNFPRIDHFKPLEMTHRAERWEINNSAALMQGHLEEYIQLMQQDDALCVGAIMEASRQTTRIVQGIDEMMEYLKYNQDILLSDTSHDIFYLYYDLLIHVDASRYDTQPLIQTMDRLAGIISKLGIYDRALAAARIKEYQNYKENGSPKAACDTADAPAEEIAAADYLPHILEYAGLPAEQQKEIQDRLAEYQQLPDMQSTDNAARQLRKSIADMYYDLYYKVFIRAVTESEEPSPIIQMFLNFGFLDARLTGEENANVLYDLTAHLQICNSDHIYTIFTWLKSIYEGKNEPSINEFDLDYAAHLAEQKKEGYLTAEQVASLEQNQDMKLRYEIENMFSSGNRSTYGKISTFCPVLCEFDLINSIDKMLVTVQKLEDAIELIKKIDFSVFYRETTFSDPQHGINAEPIQQEVVPNIILMPNAGTRAMMWQEIAGKKRDTPARFLFPIFTAVDINDTMIETVGRYRWEICRRIQGVHWNDFRDKSLTSEYFDYIQYYRKNHDLSADAKEKIKTALKRNRNNLREVFVKDYENWIKFEAKGSYRLNKIARDILIRYCPFSKQVREELKKNPIYQDVWQRYELQAEKALQRINALYLKYERAGGELTWELKENSEYYRM